MISSPWVDARVQPASGTARNAHRVLVIAGEPAFTLRLRQDMEMAGHLLAAVDCAEAGVVTAHAIQPDVIVADLRVVERDGCSAIPAMRAAGVLLRFATPSRLLPSAASARPVDEEKRYVDDLIAYVNGRPGQAQQHGDEDEEEAD
jgi:CheY-like chemotaxis protein